MGFFMTSLFTVLKMRKIVSASGREIFKANINTD